MNDPRESRASAKSGFQEIPSSKRISALPVWRGLHGGRRFVCVIAASATAAFAAEPDLTDIPLEDLLDKIPHTASPDRGMKAEESALAEAIAKHGGAAADALVPMLVNEDPEIYDLVTYCLLHLKEGDFRPDHLTPVAAAARKNREWLPGVIADINTDAAAEFLAKDFRRFPQTEAQIDHALQRMAPRSVPYLVAEFRESTEEESEFREKLASVFRECGDRASTAVEPLAAIALDVEQPIYLRKSAIQYLGAIGPSAKPVFDDLLALAGREPEAFKEVVTQAIADSRTPDAADLRIDAAIKQAHTDGEIYQFRSIAADIGPAAKHLSGRLVELLDDPNPNVRLGACRTLGYLENPSVWPHLGRMLKEQDWRIAYSAALSLAQLQAGDARPALEHCRDHHWYPRVRHAADYALRRMSGEEATDVDSKILGPLINQENLESMFNSFAFQDPTLQPLADLSGFDIRANPVEPKHELRFALTKDNNDAEWIQDPRSGIKVLQLTHPQLHRAIVEGAPEAIEHWKELQFFSPRVIAMEQQGKATFLAMFAGEWHGGVFVIEKGQPAKWILKDFTHAMHRWDGGLVVFTGLSHMLIDEGSVHRIVHNGTGWEAQFLYALPGCPQQTGILEDGRLFANCQGGAVAISPDGTFEYLGSGKTEEPE